VLRASFIALKPQISFCQDSWPNTGERPYVFKIVLRFKCMIHGCCLKQHVSLSLNTNSPVHVRALHAGREFLDSTTTDLTVSRTAVRRRIRIIMRPSSYRRGPHIASHSVCLSVCLSVCPSVPLSIVTERHVAPPSELQWHTCTFRLAQRATYRTAISAAQTCFTGVRNTSVTNRHSELVIVWAYMRPMFALRIAANEWAAFDRQVSNTKLPKLIDIHASFGNRRNRCRDNIEICVCVGVGVCAFA